MKKMIYTGDRPFVVILGIGRFEQEKEYKVTDYHAEILKRSGDFKEVRASEKKKENEEKGGKK